MNKYLTYAGKQPVYLGDINFMQDAVGATFAQLLRGVLNSSDNSMNAILQGCVLTHSGGTTSWTAGVVVLGGEVLPIQAGSVSGNINSLYFHVSSSLSGQRTFGDGSSHECFETRSAIINATSAGGVAVAGIKRLYDDAVYYNDDAEGFTPAGSLTRKNGLWLLFADISRDDESKQDGYLYFSLPETHRDMFTDMTLPVQMVLQNLSTGDPYVYTAVLTITKTPNQVYFHIEPTSTVLPAINSHGTLHIILPILK